VSLDSRRAFALGFQPSPIAAQLAAVREELSAAASPDGASR
jgi:hypothetical protein